VKPERVSERNWQIFTGRYVAGAKFNKLAKQFSLSQGRVVQVCEDVYRKLLKAEVEAKGKSALRDLVRLARPITKQMWEAAYFLAPEYFSGIEPTQNDELGHEYFCAGQYDATDFAWAFSLSGLQEPEAQP
jgi:hypothetical protein